MLRPLGCNVRHHPDAQSVCRDIRAGAAKYAATLSGNKAPQIDLVDQNGISLDDLPEGMARGVVFPGRPKKIECGGPLEVRAVLVPDPSDPFPEPSYAMGEGTFTASPSGWEIQYIPPNTGTATEVVTYPASTQKVTIDLTHRPEDNIWIKYSVYDIQGLLGTSSNMREGRPLSTVVITERTDEEPPTIEPLAQVELEECAGGEAVVIPFPVDAVEDNCGEVTIAGQAIALNGQPLTPPIPLDETAGALLTNPGDYTVEWIATDQAGNQSEPVLQTVTLNACMGAGSSLQIQNSVTLKNPDGSPMATMVLGNGSTLIGGQSSIGSVTSAASVQIDGGAVVAGDAISAGAIVVHAGAVVQGQVQANQNLQLPAPPGIIGTFPAQCGPAVQYNADAGEHELATRLLRGAPSRLSYPDRAPGRRLRLSSAAGRTGSRRITAGHAAVDVRDDLTFRGRLQLPTGEEGRLALQYRGTNVALVEAPFSGSVLAPQGTLVLGGNHGQVFRGRFYGQNVDVRAGLQVVSEPGLGTFGTLSYQEQRLSHESRSSAEVGGCSAAPGRVPGSWEYLALLSLGGLLLGTRRRRLC